MLLRGSEKKPISSYGEMLGKPLQKCLFVIHLQTEELLCSALNLMLKNNLLHYEDGVSRGSACYIHGQKIPLSAPTLQNGQTHSNNSSALDDEWFECV